MVALMDLGLGLPVVQAAAVTVVILIMQAVRLHLAVKATLAAQV